MSGSVLIVGYVSTYDWCFNWKFLDKWKKFYPHAEYHVLDNTGHYVLEDSSEKVIELMETFI